MGNLWIAAAEGTASFFCCFTALQHIALNFAKNFSEGGDEDDAESNGSRFLEDKQGGYSECLLAASDEIIHGSIQIAARHERNQYRNKQDNSGRFQ